VEFQQATTIREGDEVLVDGILGTVISCPTLGSVYLGKGVMGSIKMFNVKTFFGEVLEDVSNEEVEAV
jgi:hypothetical protein